MLCSILHSLDRVACWQEHQVSRAADFCGLSCRFPPRLFVAVKKVGKIFLLETDDGIKLWAEPKYYQVCWSDIEKTLKASLGVMVSTLFMVVNTQRAILSVSIHDLYPKVYLRKTLW
ncbi:hypothetical protein CPC735_023750 [Coccidioides posadasii C735 delta SOWgp]|uniref:Uncharacterized protein n=2 Tax=Coccidioides posadasii TaxID=199306 RepID=A0A0J6FBT0_COCPO|nr:hypothetical protein CPC735_023750 [Coccidioides posadasii C735 delta SOWgp]EER27039.1 hypothetical protein CPC735_023750 [Coccidioides posadasii C735 delta SOWgp]KMM66715.1 hypothetical protein CPAG_03053 [Coccidioides posadasii RMSCC 3488]|eukprot:XP_003069184.1 hypothetical protein CPC735_023750 [Coccidioides posadasii C735 delta SOWgp]